MRKPRAIRGIIRLTRYQEYVASATVTTLLGVLVSGAHLSWWSIPRLVLVLAANILAICFAFMISDIEDAPDDALSEVKAKRNPVSSGSLARRTAYIASFGVAVVSGVIFFILGAIPFWLGIATLFLGVLYSWRVIRLKSIPVLDLISHSLMLAGLQLLSAYFAFTPYNGLWGSWVAPFLLAVCISMYGELYNEVRDLACDKAAGVTHTVAVIGKRRAHVLMGGLLVASGLILVYCVVVGIFPLWFILSLAFVVTLLFGWNMVRTGKQISIDGSGSLHQSVMFLSTMVALVWMVERFFEG